MSSPVGTRGTDYEMVVERGKIAEFVRHQADRRRGGQRVSGLPSPRPTVNLIR
jgi:hypothetical protein